MGLFDNLKNVAKAVSNVAGKMAETGATNNGNDEFKELTDVEKHGSISGDCLPKAKGNLLYFSIDNDNNSLKIFETVVGSFKSKNILMAEYSLDDIVEIKHNQSKEMNLKTSIMTSYDNTLVLSSGEVLNIHNSITVRDEITQHSLKNEVEDWTSVSIIILTFIPKVKDDKTKEWINQFYLSNGGKAPFNEKGEIDLDTYFDVHKEMFDNKQNEWDEKANSLQ